MISAIGGVALALAMSYNYAEDDDPDANVVSRVYQHPTIPAKVSVLYDSADDVEVDFEQRFGRLLQALEWRVATGSTVVAVHQSEPCRVLVTTGRTSTTVVVSFLGDGCQVQGYGGKIGQVKGTDEIYMKDFIPILQGLQKPVVSLSKDYS